jgi:hypothetical protein
MSRRRRRGRLSGMVVSTHVRVHSRYGLDWHGEEHWRLSKAIPVVAMGAFESAREPLLW